MKLKVNDRVRLQNPNINHIGTVLHVLTVEADKLASFDIDYAFILWDDGIPTVHRQKDLVKVS